MSYDREHLHMLPEHMRQSVSDWIERAEPHPAQMGSFLRAVLSDKLVEAYAAADEANTVAMREWAAFLYEYAPRNAWGSYEALSAWHAAHHMTSGEP
jgi:hypothetical protein